MKIKSKHEHFRREFSREYVKVLYENFLCKFTLSKWSSEGDAISQALDVAIVINQGLNLKEILDLWYLTIKFLLSHGIADFGLSQEQKMQNGTQLIHQTNNVVWRSAVLER